MTAATTPHEPPARGPGFFNQMQAEWTKLRSTRAFYIQMGLTVLLTVGVSALLALAIGSTWSDVNEADRSDFDPVFVSLFGLVFSDIVLAVTGTTLLSSEYTSGMIRLTMTVTPRRLKVLFAKAAMITLVMLAIGLVVLIGSLLAVQAVLGSYEGVPTASLDEPDSRRAFVAAWLTTPLFPLIGLALGGILRSTAPAITAVMVLIFAPAIFGGILPIWWQENVIAYLPGNASDSLLRESDDSITYLEPPIATATIAAWLAAFYGVTALLISRRDV